MGGDDVALAADEEAEPAPDPLAFTGGPGAARRGPRGSNGDPVEPGGPVLGPAGDGFDLVFGIGRLPPNTADQIEAVGAFDDLHHHEDPVFFILVTGAGVKALDCRPAGMPTVSWIVTVAAVTTGVNFADQSLSEPPGIPAGGFGKFLGINEFRPVIGGFAGRQEKLLLRLYFQQVADTGNRRAAEPFSPALHPFIGNRKGKRPGGPGLPPPGAAAFFACSRGLGLGFSAFLFEAPQLVPLAFFGAYPLGDLRVAALKPGKRPGRLLVALRAALKYHSSALALSRRTPVPVS